MIEAYENKHIFLWKPISASELCEMAYINLHLQNIISQFWEEKSKLWDINSQLQEKSQNREIKCLNYLFYFVVETKTQNYET